MIRARCYWQNLETGELHVSKAWLRWAEHLDAAELGDGVVVIHHSALNHGLSTQAPAAGNYRVVSLEPYGMRCELIGEPWDDCTCTRPRSGTLYRNLDPFADDLVDA